MPLLEVKNLSVRYDKAQILNGVSLAVDAGEFVGLVGPNGAGKSTLLRAISGLVRFEERMKRGTTGDIVLEGEVRFAGERIDALAVARDPHARPGALPGAAPPVPRADGAGESARRGVPVQEFGRDAAAAGPLLCAISEVVGTHGADRRNAVRRRAADARHGARADVRSQAAGDRRALARAGAAHPRGVVRRDRARSTPRACRCCSWSRRSVRCSAWRAAATCCLRDASSPKARRSH